MRDEQIFHRCTWREIFCSHKFKITRAFNFVFGWHIFQVLSTSLSILGEGGCIHPNVMKNIAILLWRHFKLFHKGSLATNKLSFFLFYILIDIMKFFFFILLFRSCEISQEFHHLRVTFTTNPLEMSIFHSNFGHQKITKLSE